MMVWAWYLYIPVKINHNICYERVVYKSEKKNDRVKGRCKQTIGDYQKRIFKKTESWPQIMVHHGLGYIQHRGNKHYLEWDYREKFEFDLHNILTYIDFVPEKLQTPIVLNIRDILQDNHNNIQNGIQECHKYLSEDSQYTFDKLCENSNMKEISLPENVYWGKKHGLSPEQYNHPIFKNLNKKSKEIGRSFISQIIKKSR